MIKFSVFICNYNNAAYLAQAIESVLRQSYPHWELVLVDDGSTDDSLSIMEKFALKDSRIILLHNLTNQGVGAACKLAVEKSSGEILGKLDADDALTEDALKTIASAHEKHPEASLIYSTHYECDENLKVLRKANWVKPLLPGKSIIEIQNSCVSHFAAFKRSAYERTEGFDPFFKKAVDQDIYLKLEEAGPLVFIHAVLYFYRNNPAGISRISTGKTAYHYHLIAMQNAHFRRQKTGFLNLSEKRLSLYLKMARLGITPSGSWVSRIIFYACWRLTLFIP